tara:strand:+ start:666 stop:2066 length:1401 start_codon:yes stop_codon:yes gene_type:complete
MSNKKISQLGLAADVTVNDLFQVVDKEDTSMSPSGTNKRITAQTLGNFLPVTATGSSASRSLKDRFADTVNVKDFGAVGDGATDDTGAFQAALNYCSLNGDKSLFVSTGSYKITSTLNLEDIVIVGESMRGSTLIGTNALNVNNPIIKLGGSGGLWNIALCYDSSAISGSESYGQRVAVGFSVASGSSRISQRCTAMHNVLIYRCGTGVFSGSEAVVFSCIFDSIEIADFTYAGFMMDSWTRTGNVYRNIYISSKDRANAVVGFALVGQSSEESVDQINVEDTILNSAVWFKNVGAISVGTIHIEGVQQRNTYSGLVLVETTSGKIDSLSVYYTRQSVAGAGVVQVGNAGCIIGTAANPLTPRQTTSRLEINTLNLVSLNDPNSTKFPTWPNARGLAPTVDYAILRRTSGATGVFTVAVNSYSYYWHQTNDDVNGDWSLPSGTVRNYILDVSNINVERFSNLIVPW